MRWASAVRVWNGQENLVQVYECEPCGGVELDDATVAPPLQAQLEPLLAVRPMRGSGFVYRAFPGSPKT